MSEFGCASVFGDKFHGKTPEELQSNLAKMGAFLPRDVYYVDCSWVQRGDEEVIEVEQVLPVKPEPVEVIVEAVVETTESVNQPLISLGVEPKKSQPEVDWDLVKTWDKGGKHQKLALDEYAETFGVSLNRRNTFENMVKDFKEQLKNL